MNKNELRHKLEEDLRGDWHCNFITKLDMYKTLDDFESWLETAKPGDVYYYHRNSYKLIAEYEIYIWKNAKARESGEALYIEPISSKTNLEIIKKEVEKCEIEPTGCIEIFDKDEENAILHFENGKWSEVV